MFKQKQKAALPNHFYGNIESDNKEWIQCEVSSASGLGGIATEYLHARMQHQVKWLLEHADMLLLLQICLAFVLKSQLEFGDVVEWLAPNELATSQTVRPEELSCLFMVEVETLLHNFLHTFGTRYTAASCFGKQTWRSFPRIDVAIYETNVLSVGMFLLCG